MSNWSRLIVCWWQLDDAVRGADDARARSILEALRLQTSRCGLAGMTGRGGELGGTAGYDGACETVAVYAVESFNPEEFAPLLYGFAWEKPECVEFFWKSEDDTNYNRIVWQPDDPNAVPQPAD